VTDERCAAMGSDDNPEVSDAAYRDALGRLFGEGETVGEEKKPKSESQPNDKAESAKTDWPPRHVDPPPGGWDALVRCTIQLGESKMHHAVTKAMNALAAKQTEAKVFQRSGWLMRPLIEPAIAAPVNGMPRTTHTAAMINLTDGYLELLLR